MDRLIRKENLDLKLKPYNVLACSGNPPYHGTYLTTLRETALKDNISWFPCLYVVIVPHANYSGPWFLGYFGQDN